MASQHPSAGPETAGRFACIGCGSRSPETSLDETLSLTLKYGWRLTRRVSEGENVVDARCPECAAKIRSIKAKRSSLAR
jgi:hypothetical protein